MPQSARKAPHARRALRKGVAEHRAVRFARDDVRIAELRGRMLDDAGNQQRPIHHQSRLEHDPSPFFNEA